jgi:hypothetical protein
MECRCHAIKDSTQEKDSEIKSGKVMMEEELTGHQEEGGVVETPTQREESAEAAVFNDNS